MVGVDFPCAFFPCCCCRVSYTMSKYNSRLLHSYNTPARMAYNTCATISSLLAYTYKRKY